jgi:hypothetical protein
MRQRRLSCLKVAYHEKFHERVFQSAFGHERFRPFHDTQDQKSSERFINSK